MITLDLGNVFAGKAKFKFPRVRKLAWIHFQNNWSQQLKTIEVSLDAFNIVFKKKIIFQN